MNYDKVRTVIESLYEGSCTITEYQSNMDPITKVTKFQEKVVIENHPCRLSFKNISPVNSEGSVNSSIQEIKLFIAPEIVIKPGSKITVNQNGVTRDYEGAGEPAIYPTHQELVLKLKEWA
ncbi:hypothetical protein GND95_08680 [Defluviitalea raffinosedens]|uniref:Phage protein n=2 Tax=Defluviitalea raffinosedens TaxID=1450156 RepID=A0A7C8HHY9_9FIRM|nr:hypothetical protein GND95_08680 [Defluviitalea raffinosedens]